MRNSYRPLLFILAAVIVVIAFSLYNKHPQAHDDTPWRGDLAAARAESAKTGKPLLAYFTATWCGPCQRMKETTFSDPAVQTILASYVPVKIDIDEHKDLALQYHVESIPHFVLSDPSGQTTAIADGYHGPADFLALLTRPTVIIQTRPSTQPVTRP
jgi:thioredoxin-related protein